MKKLLVIIAIAIASSVVASAQTKKTAKEEASYTSREVVAGIEHGMKYKEIKKLYNPKEYESTLSDRYSPAWSGVASFVIPGLGQMVSGEVGRGFAWLGGGVACLIVTGTGNGLLQAGTENDNPGLRTTGRILSLVGTLSLAAVDICSLIDAIKVAKVKNMYEQDLRKKADVNVALYPSVNYIPTGNGAQTTTGFTLAFNF